MIPLYKSLSLKDGTPVKNPIYFFRKAMGKFPEDEAAIIVLNSEDAANNLVTVGDLIPSEVSYMLPFSSDIENLEGLGWYDVEVSSSQPLWDVNVEPNADRDGSLASEPRMVQRIITLRGFVRGNHPEDLYRAINYLNYSFDPVVNFLEGSSTFTHTLFPNAQPFSNVGFGVLAWFSADEEMTAGAEPYEELNRFLFVRSLARPVQLETKFDDFNAAFSIQLLAADPTVYEFIGPTSFNQTIHTVNGESINPDGSNGPTVTSTEAIIQPDELWSPKGPGYREETDDLFEDSV